VRSIRWHGHYDSARTFAVNPARQRRAPLRAYGGLTAQRGQVTGHHAENAEKPPLGPTSNWLVLFSDRRTGHMGDNLWAEWIVERLQGPLLQVDVAQIVIHEADEPDALVNLLDAERLTGKNH